MCLCMSASVYVCVCVSDNFYGRHSNLVLFSREFTRTWHNEVQMRDRKVSHIIEIYMLESSRQEEKGEREVEGSLA